MKKLLLIGGFFLCALCGADVCLEKLKTIPEKPTGSDQIIQALIQLEQTFSDPCRAEASVGARRSRLQRLYLEQLSAVPTDPNDLELFFRAFLVPSTEFKKLAVKLKANHPRVRGDLKKAFGGYAVVRGVPVLGTNSTQRLTKIIEKICPSELCGFWNSRALFRVVTTKRAGVAAYIPEIATLVLSLDLLKVESALSDFVLVHELAHVWVANEKIEARDPLAEFGALSGWQTAQGKLSPPKTKVLGAWVDSLVHMSNESPFSILPDAVLANEAAGLDGFVTQRSYGESLERNNLGEDLADHVAAYFVVPARFCWRGQLLAPRKLAWAEARFGRSVKVDCQKHPPSELRD
ncbi:MAG: hypothetical protein HYR96_04315 [Deltaproteobacteria bacterium]|nr:hypothetical protein [Deltaproteobacteria bacterium]MBI3295404.1 hypothetical protein [Deltaproteobacteria bacterium]